jgi:hypothetical protein
MPEPDPGKASCETQETRPRARHAPGKRVLQTYQRLLRSRLPVNGSMPMMVTSDMDVLSFCDGFNTHHIGTLRCRQEGASTPSTEPPKPINIKLLASKSAVRLNRLCGLAKAAA